MLWVEVERDRHAFSTLCHLLFVVRVSMFFTLLVFPFLQSWVQFMSHDHAFLSLFFVDRFGLFFPPFRQFALTSLLLFFSSSLSLPFFGLSDCSRFRFHAPSEKQCHRNAEKWKQRLTRITQTQKAKGNDVQTRQEIELTEKEWYEGKEKQANSAPSREDVSLLRGCLWWKSKTGSTAVGNIWQRNERWEVRTNMYTQKQREIERGEKTAESANSLRKRREKAKKRISEKTRERMRRRRRGTAQ